MTLVMSAPSLASSPAPTKSGQRDRHRLDVAAGHVDRDHRTGRPGEGCGDERHGNQGERLADMAANGGGRWHCGTPHGFLACL